MRRVSFRSTGVMIMGGCWLKESLFIPAAWSWYFADEDGIHLGFRVIQRWITNEKDTIS